ncbi:MAG: hypothetical protein IIW01_05600, partial [Thermoguttaceae bacterium]|nr:hypothetical protein [Thermoguttaceae bacterium]
MKNFGERVESENYRRVRETEIKLEPETVGVAFVGLGVEAGNVLKTGRVVDRREALYFVAETVGRGAGRSERFVGELR